jgi:uncharacterized protein YkwD
MKKNIILSMSLIITLFSVLSCAPAVSQQEYDRVNNELSETQSQLGLLQSELAEAEILQAKYDELSNNYDAVRSELAEAEILQAEYDELDDKYDELDAKYGELNKQYNILIEGTIITEEDIEQAVFELINEERQDNGLNELAWNRTLHSWAKSHSRDMATRKRLEYSEDSAWQDIWKAAGYSTVDRLASAALMIWKDSKRYEGQFLAKGAKLGAVAAYKSGEVFYITYFAHFDF